MTMRELGKQRNKLLMYSNILELYLRHKTEDIPVTVVLRKYIFPIYPISRTTLYTILDTPVKKELEKVEQQIAQQTALSLDC